MGVRGLTGYIARHAELYLKPFELHDCNLVIDGDNLACNLYKDVTGTYSAFGGDYDDFYRSVLEFFHVLAECNVTAYVLMDGGYEQKKLGTVAQRLRGKIAIIKRINPNGSVPVFPTMMKEVFVDAVRDAGVPVMRCVFEADDELAALGRKLNCPVLSYDSDFYIHNVRYIPLVTLTVKAHTKKAKDADEDGASRRLRKAEAKHVEKNTKANRILRKIEVNNVERRSGKAKTYKYMDCCMYRVENLIGGRSLTADKLPLFAAMLGNDYITRSSFRNFFATGMGKAGRSRKRNRLHARIRHILLWLKNETVESALEKILVRLKKRQRESLRSQVMAAICGYSNEMCHSYDFFKDNYENAFKEHMKPEDEEEEEDDDDEGIEEVDEESEDVAEDDEKEDDEEEEDEEDPEGEEEEDQEAVEVSGEEAEADDDVIDKSLWFPQWFLKKLYPAHLPRFSVDLLHLRKYINSPQIEHFPFNECNEIALPILIYIFTLLHSAPEEGTANKDSEEASQIDQPSSPSDGPVKDPQTECPAEQPVEFTYMTRCTRVTNIQYRRYAKEAIPNLKFDPANPDPLLLRRVFGGKLEKHLDVDKLFADVQQLPADLQLYFLGIVYWLHQSVHCDMLHVHSLVIGLIVLRTIDPRVPAERDLKAFQKRYGKVLKREAEVRAKETAEGVQRSIRPELLELSPAQRIEHIPKSDCFLVMHRLLRHFHMQEIFKRKYDSYSSAVLHGFSELQAVTLQLHTLNGLLDGAYASPRMGDLFCGVFLYNMYDLLRTRPDIRYYVRHYVFEESRMMYDLYGYLMDWLEPFIPAWKQSSVTESKPSATKKALKKQRQAARKAQETVDPHEDMLPQDSSAGEDEFFDLNNKFCALKVR